ncbi:MAG: phycobilisome protein [Cyanobacteria bacterium P01_A01_bin.123]
MQAINRQIEDKIIDADGRYLSDEEMQPLLNYLSTYKNRLQSYYYLSQKSDAIILKALQQLKLSHPDIVEKHGQKCQFDMTEILRYVALAMLRDDEAFFKEKLLFWHCTMIRAHSGPAIAAYQHLKATIDGSMAPAQASLIHPYLDLLINSLHTYQ